MIVEDYFRTLQNHPAVGGSGTLDDYRAVIPFAPKPKRKEGLPPIGIRV